MSIGIRFRQLRQQLKLSQEKIGELVGVTKGMVSQWENDTVTPPMDRLIELHKHHEFSFDWLLTGHLSTGAKIELQLSVQQKKIWYQVGIRLLNLTKEQTGKSNIVFLQIQLKLNLQEVDHANSTAQTHQNTAGRIYQFKQKWD